MKTVLELAEPTIQALPQEDPSMGPCNPDCQVGPCNPERRCDPNDSPFRQSAALSAKLSQRQP
jgi:hypothetical protein